MPGHWSERRGGGAGRAPPAPGAAPAARLRGGRPATPAGVWAGPPQVVTVAPDSTARYQTVTIGRDLGSWVQVTGGLAEGSVVVVNPADDLRDGSRVRVAADSTRSAVASSDTSSRSRPP